MTGPGADRCGRCGGLLGAGAAFCPRCGAALTQPAATVAPVANQTVRRSEISLRKAPAVAEPYEYAPPRDWQPAPPSLGVQQTVVHVHQPPGYNALAIVAFVASFFISIVGIVCGHVALSQIKRTGERGRGFAIAALILGYAAVLLSVLAVLLVFGLLAALTSAGNDAASQYTYAVGTPTYAATYPAATTAYAAPTSPVPTSSATAAAGSATVVAGPIRTADCTATATGDVQDFLAANGCGAVTRALLTTVTPDGRPVLVARAVVEFASASAASSFASLVLADGTGDIATLSPVGVGLPGAFAADATYRSGTTDGGENAFVLRAMWLDGTPTQADDPLLLAALAGVPLS